MCAATFLVTLLMPLAASAAELVMVEQQGCYWCTAWDKQIAPIYPKTAEGRFAPLRRVDIDAVPETLSLTSRLAYTPTFLLVEQDREIARLEGYPGEDFFWGLLEQMLQSHTEYEGMP